jgi:hypothetical protein
VEDDLLGQLASRGQIFFSSYNSKFCGFEQQFIDRVHAKASLEIPGKMPIPLPVEMLVAKITNRKSNA